MKTSFDTEKVNNTVYKNEADNDPFNFVNSLLKSKKNN